jgi:3-hydroxyisobutyrate dehydrogenase
MTRPLPEHSLRLVTPAETHVGWIGTGVMGASMCQHLHTKQYRLTLYTRNRSKASPILARARPGPIPLAQSLSRQRS